MNVAERKWDYRCSHCRLKWTAEEAMNKGYECCNPESMEWIEQGDDQ